MREPYESPSAKGSMKIFPHRDAIPSMNLRHGGRHIQRLAAGRADGRAEEMAYPLSQGRVAGIDTNFTEPFSGRRQFLRLPRQDWRPAGLGVSPPVFRWAKKSKLTDRQMQIRPARPPPP